jgi:hypothetical protein
VEVGEHRRDAVAEVILHAGAGRECRIAGGVDDQRVAIVGDAPEGVAQLGEHGDVEDVQRRIVQRDAVRVGAGREGDHQCAARRLPADGGGAVVHTSTEWSVRR